MIRILPLVVLAAATFLPAQQAVKSTGTRGIVLTPPSTPAPDCPVGIQASHAKGNPVGMNAGSDAHVLVQNIHLTMTNQLSHEIVAAQFVVHGYSARWRAMNLAGSSQSPDLAKTVDLVLDMKGKGQASRDLSLRRFAAVTSIDLSSVTYADGNIWQAPSSAACSVTPDMAMLVASTQ